MVTAATSGAKSPTTAANIVSATSPTAKVSSAELLSMLKKPAAAAVSPSAVGYSGAMNSFAPEPMATKSPTIVSESSIPRPRDDFSLTGLIDLIRSCPQDRNILTVGVNLDGCGGGIDGDSNASAPGAGKSTSKSYFSPWYFDNEADDDDDELKHKADGGFDRIDVGRDAVHPLHARSSHLDTGILGGFAALSLTIPQGAMTSSSNPASSSLAAAEFNNPSVSSAARRPSTLDTILPGCYSVPSLPPAATKMSSFADETLFYIFYAMPRDRMQELAAKELFEREWRFHKPSKCWINIINDSSTSANAQSSISTTAATAFIFDSSAWMKLKKSLVILPGDLEESRPSPSTSSSSNSSANSSANANANSSAKSPIMNMHGSGTLQNAAVTH